MIIVSEVDGICSSVWCWYRSRVCVMQVFACMQELLKTEEDDSDRMLHNIHDLATQLYQNVS